MEKNLQLERLAKLDLAQRLTPTGPQRKRNSMRQTMLKKRMKTFKEGDLELRLV